MPAKAKAAGKSAAEVKKLLEHVKAILEGQMRFETPAAAPAAAASVPAPPPAAAAGAPAAAEPMSASKKKREKEKAKKAAAAGADAKIAPAAAATAPAPAKPVAAVKPTEAKATAPAAATAAAAAEKPRLRRDTEAELWSDVVELWKVMSQVMKLQADLDADDLADEQAAATPAIKAERMRAFAQWLAVKAPDSKVGEKFEFVTSVAEGSGVRALKDLSDGEHFMSIPRRVCMTLDTATDPHRSAQPRLVDLLTAPDSVCRAIPSLGLAVHLLMERLSGEQSYWHEYIACLPRAASSFALPIVFSLDELRYLRGSPLLYDTLRLQKSTMRQYASVYLQIAKAGHLKLPLFSFRQFRWAVAVVMTRQNRLPRLGADGSPLPPNSSGGAGNNTIALIPGWDFCNYSDGKVATYYNARDDASESFAMAPVRKGDQIYIYYGTRPNAKLFMFSGFLYDAHSNDYADAVLDFHALCPPLTDPLFKLKQLLLHNLGIRSPNPEKGGPDALPSQHWFALPAALELAPAAADADRPNLMSPGFRSLLPFLRVCFLDKDEAARALKLKPTDPNSSPAGEQGLLPFVSERNERAALAYAAAWIASQRAAYRFTEAELDAALAADGKLPPLPPAPNADGADAKDAKAPAAVAAGAAAAAAAAGAAVSPNVRLALRMVRIEVRLWARAAAAVSARVALLDTNNTHPGAAAIAAAAK